MSVLFELVRPHRKLEILAVEADLLVAVHGAIGQKSVDVDRLRSGSGQNGAEGTGKKESVFKLKTSLRGVPFCLGWKVPFEAKKAALPVKKPRLSARLKTMNTTNRRRALPPPPCLDKIPT